MRKIKITSQWRNAQGKKFIEDLGEIEVSISSLPDIFMLEVQLNASNSRRYHFEEVADNG